MVSSSLEKSRYSHTRDEIDFTALKGKRVAVLGAGASAFDNASVALESGAQSVDLFFRRKRLPNVNAYRWAENVGYLRHHGDLSDAKRWRFVSQIIRMGQLPPTDTFRRATRNPNFQMHAGSCWESVRETEQGIVIETTNERFEVDFLICGTGFRTDLSQRPELKGCHEQIALWGDRFTPAPEDGNEDLLRHPYLGPGFEFVPKEPERAPWISYLYNYTFGCLLSLGFGGASISGMKYSIPRIVGAITRSFYQEDADAHFDSLVEFSSEEFSMDDMGGIE
jgi:cation diffusion facilitator CzcD-associated flavoprotein CzcO